MKHYNKTKTKIFNKKVKEKQIYKKVCKNHIKPN